MGTPMGIGLTNCVPRISVDASCLDEEHYSRQLHVQSSPNAGCLVRCCYMFMQGSTPTAHYQKVYSENTKLCYAMLLLLPSISCHSWCNIKHQHIETPLDRLRVKRKLLQDTQRPQPSFNSSTSCNKDEVSRLMVSFTCFGGGRYHWLCSRSSGESRMGRGCASVLNTYSFRETTCTLFLSFISFFTPLSP